MLNVIPVSAATIKTARLQLTPYSPAHLLALMDGEDLFWSRFGLPAADGLRTFIVSDEVSPAWLARLRTTESADPWIHGFAVVERQSQLVIGSVGFKGPPDEDGTVEIAYGIVPAFQGRGYATEAASAGVAFAFGRSGVRRIRAHTLPTSHASARVLEKCGFEWIGDVEDPEDGRVRRWERVNTGMVERSRPGATRRS